MIKKLISSTTFALVAVAMSAAPISRQQAMSRAQASLAKQGIDINVASMQAMPLKAHGTHATATPAYYVFNSSNSFVIAAGDDRMPEVLGYSDNGTIDPNDMPDGLKDLLECYEVEVAHLGSSDGMPLPNGSISRTPIAPLLTSKWDQGSPFNNLCPVYDGTNRAVTGCVATAMAQVMNYWKWPATISNPIPAYTTETKGISMPALSASGFPGFSNVKDYYFWNQSDASTTAVAKLMLYVGQSLEMNYNNSSGAATADIPTALYKYFRYANTGRYLRRENYTAEEWATLIYTELAARRPVVYRGSAYNGGGHSFVCDGMDANGLFHINWGWNGQSDGYFLLTNLNPSDQGAGSSVSNDGYIVGSAMVVGITPENKTTSINDAPMYCTNFVNEKATYTRSSSGQSFSNVKVHCGMYSQYPSTADIDFGIGLYTTSGTLKQVVYSGWFSQLPSGYGSTNDWTFNIPSSIANGTYYLKPICRLHNTGNWVPCAGANVNYWQATITTTAFTFKSDGNSAEPSYRVNSVTYGKRETNRPIEMVMNMTNNSSNYFRQLYMLVDNKCTTVAQCAIEPGQTGNITMHISAATTGSHSVKLCYDEGGQNVLWQSSVYITAAPAASIAASSFSVKNAVSGKINDNKFAFTTKVTNNGSSTYDDYIVARIFRRTGTNTGSMVSQEIKNVSIASRGSQTLSFEFPDLVQNEDYFILMYYYSNGQLTNCGGTGFYTILGASYKKGDVNGDGTVDINDANILINILLGKDTASKYSGRADVDGNGTVDITDANILINTLLGK
ncbi:C10 family peptidase [Sodaliphilus sp.]|uniref:C10 family peptidase n=1 Tax=Sodaliphilus sp. TaxID=2815818 RepID=UPI0038905ACB